MNRRLHKGLSLLLAFVMVIGTMAYAATAVSAAPETLTECIFVSGVSDKTAQLPQPAVGGVFSGLEFRHYEKEEVGYMTVETEVKDPDVPLENEFPFTDVKKDDWSYENVLFVYRNELMKGTSDNVFSPNTPLDRAMVVTILYRLADEAANDTESMTRDSIFTDVASGVWYTEAVIWAAANDIVNGYGDGRFGPTDSITREDLATIIMRFLNMTGTSISVTQQYIPFGDEESIAVYAKGAIQTLCKLGIINGVSIDIHGQTIIDPKGNATRAQTAAILNRFTLILETLNNS